MPYQNNFYTQTYYPSISSNPYQNNIFQPNPQNSATASVAPSAPQAGNGGIVWVQGAEAAKAFLVAPNTTVPLFDIENQTIYIKSADASGMPSMRILDYVERQPNAPRNPLSSSGQAAGVDLSDYITRKELGEIIDAKLTAFAASSKPKKSKEMSDNV